MHAGLTWLEDANRALKSEKFDGLPRPHSGCLLVSFFLPLAQPARAWHAWEQSVSEYYRIANSTRVPTWAAAWGRVRVCKSSPHQYLIIAEIHMYLATRLHYRRQEAGRRAR